MDHFIHVMIDGHNTVVFEVEDSSDEIVRSARPGETVGRMTEDLTAALTRFRTLAETMIGTFADLSEQPDEITVGFGIKATAAAGLVVAQASGEATFTVNLRWRRAT